MRLDAESRRITPDARWDARAIHGAALWELAACRLHVAGVQHIPRGPRASTRNNPAGLTDQQLEVLLLMAEGFSNSEIAVKLSASPRTIEHHTSAILAKLHARSRTQAVAAARNLGAIPNSR